MNVEEFKCKLANELSSVEDTQYVVNSCYCFGTSWDERYEFFCKKDIKFKISLDNVVIPCFDKIKCDNNYNKILDFYLNGVKICSVGIHQIDKNLIKLTQLSD